jgi:hypothetical protein
MTIKFPYVIDPPKTNGQVFIVYTSNFHALKTLFHMCYNVFIVTQSPIQIGPHFLMLFNLNALM